MSAYTDTINRQRVMVRENDEDRRRCAGGGHRILPVLRLVMVRISCDPEGYASSGSFSAEKPVVNA